MPLFFMTILLSVRCDALSPQKVLVSLGHGSNQILKTNAAEGRMGPPAGKIPGKTMVWIAADGRRPPRSKKGCPAEAGKPFHFTLLVRLPQEQARCLAVHEVRSSGPGAPHLSAALPAALAPFAATANSRFILVTSWAISLVSPSPFTLTLLQAA
jgi:hypothetical protein